MLHSQNILQSFANEALYSFEEVDRLTLDRGQAISVLCGSVTHSRGAYHSKCQAEAFLHVIETNNQNSNNMETTCATRRIMRQLADEAEALRQSMIKETLDEMLYLAEYGY